MDAEKLQDRISRGMGTAARAMGVTCNAFRPVGAQQPLAPGNRFLQLNAAFNAQDTLFRRAGMPAQAAWYCVCDAAYLLPGDYLVELTSERIWFIGALQSLLPVLCVLTNRTIDVTRPATYRVAGLNGYGGGEAATPIVSDFPVSLLHGSETRGPQAIPSDTRIGGAVALLPPIPNVCFCRGDIMTDDLGRSYVASQVEQNMIGWRIELRQATA